MWDLTHAERRAFAASLFLVGLAGVGRTAWTPSSTGLQWQDVGLSGGDAPRDSVAAALAREARAQTPLAPGEEIDVGTAPLEELRRLPGIGPGLASAIIREREARPFGRVADLERVPGIGPATMARLTEYARVSEPVAAPARSEGRASAFGPIDGAPGCGAGRLDINRAGPEALQALPGIGPALAGRIVAHRDREGRFHSVEALEEVSGIGPASLARLASAVCIG